MANSKLIHSQVLVGLKKISNCIISLIIENKGEVELGVVEGYTGLRNVSNNITADIILWMQSEGIVNIEGTVVKGDVQRLKKILEQQRTNIPLQHRDSWTDEKYLKLAQLKLEGASDKVVAKAMNRTEFSISSQVAYLNKSFKLVSLIQKYDTVRKFLEKSQISDQEEEEKNGILHS